MSERGGCVLGGFHDLLVLRFGLGIRILPPQVRVLQWDNEFHGLMQLRGGDPLGFNDRIVEPPV